MIIHMDKYQFLLAELHPSHHPHKDHVQGYGSDRIPIPMFQCPNVIEGMVVVMNM